MLNKRLLSKKARNDGPRDVVLNVDDTVCTVYGDQNGAGSDLFDVTQDRIDQDLTESLSACRFQNHIIIIVVKEIIGLS